MTLYNTKKKFIEYYADPDFKKKHLAHMCERIICQCGSELARSNMSNHRKTTKHKSFEESQELLSANIVQMQDNVNNQYY